MKEVLGILGSKMKKARTTLGMTQEELARKIGVEPAYYGQLERGKRSPSMQTLITIASCLKLDLDYLFEKANGKNQSFSYESIRGMIDELGPKDQKFLVGMVRDAVRHLSNN